MKTYLNRLISIILIITFLFSQAGPSYAMRSQSARESNAAGALEGDLSAVAKPNQSTAVAKAEVASALAGGTKDDAQAAYDQAVRRATRRYQAAIRRGEEPVDAQAAYRKALDEAQADLVKARLGRAAGEGAAAGFAALGLPSNRKYTIVALRKLLHPEESDLSEPAKKVVQLIEEIAPRIVESPAGDMELLMAMTPYISGPEALGWQDVLAVYSYFTRPLHMKLATFMASYVFAVHWTGAHSHSGQDYITTPQEAVDLAGTAIITDSIRGAVDILGSLASPEELRGRQHMISMTRNFSASTIDFLLNKITARESGRPYGDIRDAASSVLVQLRRLREASGASAAGEATGPAAGEIDVPQEAVERILGVFHRALNDSALLEALREQNTIWLEKEPLQAAEVGVLHLAISDTQNNYRISVNRNGAPALALKDENPPDEVKALIQRYGYRELWFEADPAVVNEVCLPELEFILTHIVPIIRYATEETTGPYYLKLKDVAAEVSVWPLKDAPTGLYAASVKAMPVDKAALEEAGKTVILPDQILGFRETMTRTLKEQTVADVGAIAEMLVHRVAVNGKVMEGDVAQALKFAWICGHTLKSSASLVAAVVAVATERGLPAVLSEELGRQIDLIYRNNYPTRSSNNIVTASERNTSESPGIIKDALDAVDLRLRAAAVLLLSDRELRLLLREVNLPSHDDNKTIRISYVGPSNTDEPVEFRILARPLAGSMHYTIEKHYKGNVLSRHTRNPAELPRIAASMLCEEQRFTYWRDWVAASKGKATGAATGFTLNEKTGKNVAFLIDVPDADKFGGQRPLVFVFHGLSGHKAEPQLEAFAKRFVSEGYIVVRPDFTNNQRTQNNQNESDGPLKDFSLEDEMDDARAVLAHLQKNMADRIYFSRTIVAGHSYGGFIARRVAAEACSNSDSPFYVLGIQAVIDMSGIVSPPGSLMKVLQRQQEQGNIQDAGQAYNEWKDTDSFDQFSGQRFYIKGWEDYDAAGDLARIPAKVPYVYIIGAQDAGVRCEGLPQAQVVSDFMAAVSSRPAGTVLGDYEMEHAYPADLLPYIVDDAYAASHAAVVFGLPKEDFRGIQETLQGAVREEHDRRKLTNIWLTHSGTWMVSYEDDTTQNHVLEGLGLADSLIGWMNQVNLYSIGISLKFLEEDCDISALEQFFSTISDVLGRVRDKAERKKSYETAFAVTGAGLVVVAVGQPLTPVDVISIHVVPGEEIAKEFPEVVAQIAAGEAAAKAKAEGEVTEQQVMDFAQTLFPHAHNLTEVLMHLAAVRRDFPPTPSLKEIMAALRQFAEEVNQVRLLNADEPSVAVPTDENIVQGAARRGVRTMREPMARYIAAQDVSMAEETVMALRFVFNYLLARQGLLRWIAEAIEPDRRVADESGFWIRAMVELYPVILADVNAQSAEPIIQRFAGDLNAQPPYLQLQLLLAHGEKTKPILEGVRSQVWGCLGEIDIRMIQFLKSHMVDDTDNVFSSLEELARQEVETVASGAAAGTVEAVMAEIRRQANAGVTTLVEIPSLIPGAQPQRFNIGPREEGIAGVRQALETFTADTNSEGVLSYVIRDNVLSVGSSRVNIVEWIHNSVVQTVDLCSAAFGDMTPAEKQVIADYLEGKQKHGLDEAAVELGYEINPDIGYTKARYILVSAGAVYEHGLGTAGFSGIFDYLCLAPADKTPENLKKAIAAVPIAAKREISSKWARVLVRAAEFDALSDKEKHDLVLEATGLVIADSTEQADAEIGRILAQEAAFGAIDIKIATSLEEVEALTKDAWPFDFIVNIATTFKVSQLPLAPVVFDAAELANERISKARLKALLIENQA